MHELQLDAVGVGEEHGIVLRHVLGILAGRIENRAAHFFDVRREGVDLRAALGAERDLGEADAVLRERRARVVGRRGLTWIPWRAGGAMDFNGHLANTAYLDLAADVRMAFFAEHGFPTAEFRRLGIGPVVRKDELEYFREIGLHETVTVTHAATAMSPDGSKFALENEIWTAGGERAAVVQSSGGWLDLRRRKLVTPPPALLEALRKIPRVEAFVELP